MTTTLVAPSAPTCDPQVPESVHARLTGGLPSPVSAWAALVAALPETGHLVTRMRLHRRDHLGRGAHLPAGLWARDEGWTPEEVTLGVLLHEEREDVSLTEALTAARAALAS